MKEARKKLLRRYPYTNGTRIDCKQYTQYMKTKYKKLNNTPIYERTYKRMQRMHPYMKVHVETTRNIPIQELEEIAKNMPIHV